MLDLVFAEPGVAPSDAARRLVNTWSDNGGEVFARAFVARRHRQIEWPGVGVFDFTPGSRTVILHPTPATTDPARARDIFFRIVQPIVLQALGAETLHASAVAGPRGVIAFAGTSGNGKSTLAWALGQRAGFHQLADDAVVIDGLSTHDSATTIQVRPLPYLPRLREPSRAALAPGQRSSSRAESASEDLRAVVLIEQHDSTEAAAAPVRVPTIEAFPAVLAHAYCFDETDRGERDRLVRHYLDLVSRVPIFRLRYRPDFTALAALLDAVVAATGIAAHRQA